MRWGQVGARHLLRVPHWHPRRAPSRRRPRGPGRSRVGVDRGAAHPLLERVPHAGAFPTAPPIPRAAQASPGGMSCRALHGGLHDREPGDWRAAEGAARDARPAWDDTVALHAECRQRTPSPDPGLAPPHGPQAILSEALRRREALQRRMLATPQGLAQRGHPGSPRVAWQQARGAEAAAQQRCWGEHLGHAGASSEDRAGVRWRSPVRQAPGRDPRTLAGSRAAPAGCAGDAHGGPGGARGVRNWGGWTAIAIIGALQSPPRRRAQPRQPQWLRLRRLPRVVRRAHRQKLPPCLHAQLIGGYLRPGLLIQAHVQQRLRRAAMPGCSKQGGRASHSAAGTVECAALPVLSKHGYQGLVLPIARQSCRPNRPSASQSRRDVHMQVRPGLCDYVT